MSAMERRPPELEWYSVIMRERHRAGHEKQCGNDKKKNAAWGVFLMRSKLGDHGAQGEAAEKFADMTAIVDTGSDESKNQAEGSPKNQTR